MGMIQIEHLVKKYGNHYALDDISFHVDAGEIVGFLGPNGAGKSTTMNILTGYLSSTSGTARVNGVDILENPMAVKRSIGYLPEQPPLYSEMTVSEYLNFVYELRDCTLNRKKHLDEVCQVTRIGEVRNRVIRNLSKGYRQRVGIAQALIGNPEVIILDEPTVGLDPKQIIEVRNLIRQLGQRHTVILSTHILPEVQAVCDRILVINQGKIIADRKTADMTRAIEDNQHYKVKVCGPQDEVLPLLSSRPGVTHCEITGERDRDSIAYLVESAPGIDIRKTLFYALAEKNFPILGLEPVGMSLEDIFIRLVDKPQKAVAGQGHSGSGSAGRRTTHLSV